jgi:hypothetical protein
MADATTTKVFQQLISFRFFPFLPCSFVFCFVFFSLNGLKYVEFVHWQMHSFKSRKTAVHYSLFWTCLCKKYKSNSFQSNPNLSSFSCSVPEGNVSFHRRALHNFPSWNESDKRISSCLLRVFLDGAIEDAPAFTDSKGVLEVDFANKVIGGGVLGHVRSSKLFNTYSIRLTISLVCFAF